MDQSYAEKYRELYRRHWWWRARESAILREIDQLGVRADGSHRILDVGCGDGLLFDALESFGFVEGVESDEATLATESKWRQRIHRQPFDESFNPESGYDLILMLDILEHLPEPEKALAHAKSLLNPGGKILMTVPAFNSLWTTHDDLNHHYVRYTRPTFHQLAQRSGIEIDRARYLFHWTCPVKLAIRIKEKVLGAKAKSPEVPNSLVNSICLCLTRLEQWTISRIGMPFGSSLLAIGSNPSQNSMRS